MGVGRAEMWVSIVIGGSVVTLVWMAIATRMPIPVVDRTESTAARNAAAAGATAGMGGASNSMGGVA